MDYLFALAGFVLLFVGGESLVRGAVALAHRFQVSPLFTGIVVVGFGTSSPELLVCVEAVLLGKDDIAVGNIVGSNIANVMLILGVAALIQPIVSQGSVLSRDGVMMLASGVILVALGLAGETPRLAGLALLAVLAGFIAYSFRGERDGDGGVGAALVAEAEEMAATPKNPWLSLLVVVVGVLALVIGSGLLVEGATGIAMAAGVPEAVIAVSLVAVGTSLPELATVIVAALRKHADVALGNVLGSNIFNVLGVLGVTALVEPVAIAPSFMVLDMWVMLGVSALLLVFMGTGRRVSRWESGVLLAGYAGYIGVLFAMPGLG